MVEICGTILMACGAIVAVAIASVFVVAAGKGIFKVLKGKSTR